MAPIVLDNLPDAVYAELKARAERGQRSLADEVAALLAAALRDDRPSLLELEGLGKELWEGIDAAEYIDNERRSWD